jgi:hypothetical protein
MPTGQQILKSKCSTGKHAIKWQAYLLLNLFPTVTAAVDGSFSSRDILVYRSRAIIE